MDGGYKLFEKLLIEDQPGLGNRENKEYRFQFTESNDDWVIYKKCARNDVEQLIRQDKKIY